MGVPRPVQGTRWLAGLALALVVLYILAAYALPFHPFQIINYTAIPAADCIGTGVNIEKTYSRSIPRFGSASHLNGATHWEEVGGTRRTTEQLYEDSLTKYKLGTHSIASDVIRTAPPEPGRWRLVTTVTVHGRILLFPRTDNILHVSGQVFETLPLSDPRCPK